MRPPRLCEVLNKNNGFKADRQPLDVEVERSLYKAKAAGLMMKGLVYLLCKQVDPRSAVQ